MAVQEFLYDIRDRVRGSGVQRQSGEQVRNPRFKTLRQEEFGYLEKKWYDVPLGLIRIPEYLIKTFFWLVWYDITGGTGRLREPRRTGEPDYNMQGIGQAYRDNFSLGIRRARQKE